MSSADLLRRAAAKLREHATAPGLTPGPWECLDEGDRIVRFKDADAWDFDYVVDEPVSNTANGRLIALMHPPVVWALIDVFESLAGAMTVAGACRDERLEAVACAVLREDGVQ
jgi:hypothetical protein